jgi:hypothetical protein
LEERVSTEFLLCQFSQNIYLEGAEAAGTDDKEPCKGGEKQRGLFSETPLCQENIKPRRINFARRAGAALLSHPGKSLPFFYLRQKRILSCTLDSTALI